MRLFNSSRTDSSYISNDGVGTFNLEPTVVTEEEWFTYYKPLPGGNSYEVDGVCYLHDNLPTTNPDYIWTMIEVNEVLFIASGIKHVDRLGYFITAIPETCGVVIECN